MKIAALIPVKLSSRRLPNKNFLFLGDKPLLGYIFETVHEIDLIDSVYCYTSRPQILDFVPRGTKLLPRPSYLDGDSISANDLFSYAINKLVGYEIIVICHPTGPYVSMEKISEAISAVASGNHDSAFAASKHETYAWYKDKPLNFDPSVMAQTQLLSPVYLETSGFYVFRRSLFVEHSRRVGFSPKIIELSIKESIDIDNPSDFALAQHMLNYNEEILPLNVPPFLFGRLGKSSAHGQIKHVSFDLDGVLVDTIPVMKEAWESVCKSFSLTVKFDEYKKLIGIPFKHILQRLGVVPEIWDDLQKSYVEMSCLYSGYMRRFDGVSELLDFVLKSDLSVSVVTSKPRERATAVLKQIMPASLKYCLVCPEDVPSGRGKPSPDPLLFACCQLGVDPSTSVYIGDMDVDREAASRAKFYFVHACWGYEQLSERNEIWFSTPRELKDYLEEVVS